MIISNDAKIEKAIHDCKKNGGRILDLSGCDLGDDFKGIIKTFPHLTHLGLTGTQTNADLGEQIDEISSDLSELAEIVLDDTDITEDGMDSLIEVLGEPDMPALRSASLCRTTFNDDHLALYRTVAEHEAMEWLVSLNVSGTDITDAGLHEWIGVMEAGGVPNLRSFEFAETAVSKDAITAWMDAIERATMSGCQTLNLAGTPADDEVLFLLATSEKGSAFSELTSLSVANTAVTDRGMDAFSKALQSGMFPQLQRLNLEGTSITDATAHSLVLAVGRLRKLQFLHLRGTRITEKGIQMLVEAAADGGFAGMKRGEFGFRAAISTAKCLLERASKTSECRN